MKKVLASVMVIVLLAALSLTAFGAGSPVSVGEWKVEGFTNYPGTLTYLPEKSHTDQTITYTKTPTADGYEFDGWTITLEDGTTAVLGDDYELVSGTLMSDTIVIRPLNDITVTENYSKIAVTPGETTTKASGPVDGGDTSPPTGGSNIPALATVALLAMSVAFITKKRLTA